MMATRSLFDQVVAASGLNELVAPFTVSRLLLRADVQPDHLDAEALARALPELERGIRPYLTDAEVDAAMGRLRVLSSSAA
jgi:hypothetical protein